MEETQTLPSVTQGGASDITGAQDKIDLKVDDPTAKFKGDNLKTKKDNLISNKAKLIQIENKDDCLEDMEVVDHDQAEESNCGSDSDLQPTDLSTKKLKATDDVEFIKENMNETKNISDTEKEENGQNTSKSDDFIIIIEPKTDSSRSQSPMSRSPTDLVPLSPDLEEVDDLGDSGLRIEGVYSLQDGQDGSKGIDHGSPSDIHSIAPVVIQPVFESHKQEPPQSQKKQSIHLPGNLSLNTRPVMLLKKNNKQLQKLQPAAGNSFRKCGNVIVLENLPEVILVRSRQVMMPSSKVKVTNDKVRGAKVIGNLETLLVHNVKALPQSVPKASLYVCPRCQIGFSVHSDWMKHRQKCLGEASEGSLLYYCNRCPASFSRHRDWVSHRKSHTIVTQKWECDRCDAKFTSRRDLRDHRTDCVDLPITKKPKFRCEICHKAFPYPSALKVHSETHVLKHKCPICDQPFTRFYEMTKHVRNKHPDVETHSCDSCGKVFDRLTMLYRHKSDGHCMPNKQC